MYAIIVAGGKQYKVAEGDTIYIEKMEVNDGDAVKFDNVLVVEKDGNVTVGAPYVEGASVSGQSREERQIQEDHRLQVQGQEELQTPPGPQTALYQSDHRKDRGVSLFPISQNIGGVTHGS